MPATATLHKSTAHPTPRSVQHSPNPPTPPTHPPQVTHQPPELLEKGLLTSSADVYSLGMLMWETYMAQGLYKDLSDGEVVAKVGSRRNSSSSSSADARTHAPGVYPGCACHRLSR
jgi:hypothetical protein